MPRQRTLVFTLALIALFLSGCTRGATVQSTAMATVAPSTVTMTTAPSPTVIPRATPSATPATPTRLSSRPSPGAGTPSPDRSRPPVFPTQPPNPGQPVAQTTHYQFFDPEGAHAATIALLAAEAEAIYTYLVDRTGLQASAPIPVVVQTQAQSECAARGIAYRDGRRISLFAGPNASPAQLRLILAHESAHILHMPHYGVDIDVTL